MVGDLTEVYFWLKYLVSLIPILNTPGWNFLQIRTASVCSGCCGAGPESLLGVPNSSASGGCLRGKDWELQRAGSQE